MQVQAAVDVGELVNLTGLGDLGLAGLITLTVLLLLTGRLLPKSYVDARVADKAEVLATERAEKAEILKLNAAQGEVIRDQNDIIRDLTIAAQVGVRVGESVHRIADTQAGG